MNINPYSLLINEPELHEPLFKYLFKIASRYYSNYGRGVLHIPLNEDLLRQFFRPEELSWFDLERLIEDNISYLSLDWKTQEKQLPSQILHDVPTLEIVRSLHQIMVDCPLVHTYRPALQGVLALSVEQGFIDFLQELDFHDYFDDFIEEEGIFFHLFSRRGIISKSA